MSESNDYNRYRDIVESLTDMIYELDVNGKFVYANNALAEVSNHTKEELKNTTFIELVRPDRQVELQDFYKSQKENRIKSSYYEFPMITKKGEEIWVGQNVTMLYDDNKVTTVRAVARNISQIKTLEKNIALNKKKLVDTSKQLNHTKSVLDEKSILLENIVDGMMESVVVINTKGEFLLFNKAASKLFGTGKADLPPSEWTKHYGVYHLDKKTPMKPEELSIMEALKGRSSDGNNVYIKNKHLKNGIFVRSSNRPLYNKKGEIIGALSVGIDVTQDHIQRQDLAESEEKFRAMSEASPLGIFVTNKKGECTYANGEYQNLSGLTLEEALGTGWTKAIHEDDLEGVANGWNEAVENKSLFDHEYRFKRKDNSVIWSKVRASAMMLNDKVVGYIGTVLDINDQKKYEDQLLMAKEYAEEATRAKEHFLSTMSHELRTPLNSVIGMSHILLDESPMPHQIENLNTLRFSAENLLAIINDILDFNKIESGNVTLEYIKTDIKDLVSRIKKALQYDADEKRIRLSAILDSDLPSTILCDPTRLNQVLTNLISNAIKFTTKGFVRIEVTVEASHEDEVDIKFNIEDSGIGIPEDQMKSIFERFSQAEDTTTRKYGGTGLGLAISKNLINLMGGKIMVTSKVNQGSKFYFTLNFKAFREKPVLNVPLKIYRTEDNNLEGVKLLLVEDNIVNQTVASKFLVKWGISIEIANNGAEALEKVQKQHFDVILMDLQMPVMDGYEATEKIKGLGSPAADIPILALTAAAIEDVKVSLSKFGINEYVTKPFDPNDLYLKISIAIKNKPKNKAYDFTKIEALAEGDHTFMKNILNSYLKEINQLKAKYSEMVKDDEINMYSVINHKYSSSLDLLQAYDIIKELELTRPLLGINNKEQLNKQANKFYKMCDELTLACIELNESL